MLVRASGGMVAGEEMLSDYGVGILLMTVCVCVPQVRSGGPEQAEIVGLVGGVATNEFTSAWWTINTVSCHDEDIFYKNAIFGLKSVRITPKR